MPVHCDPVHHPLPNDYETVRLFEGLSERAFRISQRGIVQDYWRNTRRQYAFRVWQRINRLRSFWQPTRELRNWVRYLAADNRIQQEVRREA